MQLRNRVKLNFKKNTFFHDVIILINSGPFLYSASFVCMCARWRTCAPGLFLKALLFLEKALSISMGSVGEALLLPSSSPLCDRLPPSLPLQRRDLVRHKIQRRLETTAEARWGFDSTTCCRACWGLVQRPGGRRQRELAGWALPLSRRVPSGREGGGRV